jgi:microcystin-dependent protein
MKIDLVFLCILLFVLYHVYISNKIESMADVSSDIKETIRKGSIIAFNSDKAPEGWALCDGQNGTPDLRGRFIRMASADLQQEDGATGGFGDYIVGRKSKSGSVDGSLIGNSRTDSSSWIYKMNVGDYGGTDHQVLHVNEMPVHSHIINTNYKFMTPNTYKRSFSGGGFDGYDAGGGDTQPIPGTSVGTTNAGASLGHNNIPPFYVLVYIMKL